MIDYQILEDQGIVILEPSGPLRKEDFENLTRDVDAYIERHGQVNGLIVHAKSFPGWEDFGAVSHHINFVKDHHKKIDRVAIATDSTFLSIAPEIVKHFVSAEVMHFGYDDVETAQKWIAESNCMAH
ncbi:MAG: STAS/SEC14 domain-containing protein [Pirellulales bacterium]|nr:STAS/SEC14 domain-containing protein [Pirellulales bacterium]